MLQLKPESFNLIKGYVIKKFTDTQKNTLFKIAGKYGKQAKEILLSDDYHTVLKNIKQDALLFQYVNEKYFQPSQYYDFCLIAVSLDGNTLEFINNQTIEIALTAVRNKASAIKYINAGQFTREQYFEVCLTAATKTGFPICYISYKLLSNEQYEQICLSAAKSDISIFRHIKTGRISARKYSNICLIAIKENENLLKYVDSEKLSAEKYDEICFTAFKKKQENDNNSKRKFCNDILLKYVDSKKCSPERYSELCIIEIELKIKEYDLIEVFDLIDTSKCTVEAYEKICINILNNAILYLNFYVYPNRIINFNRLKNRAFNVCLAAIEKDIYFFTKINHSEFSNEEYFLLCNTVIKKSVKLLPYVNVMKLTKDQYAEICILAVRQDKKYAKYIITNMFDD
jgi:hypothetical protein